MYQSDFTSPCGSRGIVAGPHTEFSRIEKEFRGLHANKMAYYLESLNELRRISFLSLLMPLLGEKEIPGMVEFDEPISCAPDNDQKKGISEIYYSEPLGPSSASVFTLSSEKITNVGRKAPKCVREYDEIERAGTEVTYRCIECRDCLKCKNGERIDALSIQEEIEQGLIERAVKVYPEKGITTASFPFVVADPDSLIAPKRYTVPR